MFNCPLPRNVLYWLQTNKLSLIHISARCLVLEDSYNGVRAGARGGFITVMVPDLVPADDEMRSLYTMAVSYTHLRSVTLIASYFRMPSLAIRARSRSISFF